MEGRNNKNVIYKYMKPGNNIPIFWRKFFSNSATNSDYIYNHCNNQLKKFHRHYPEWFLYNLISKFLRLVIIIILK